MTHDQEHPLWEILRRRGTTMAWLARRAGLPYSDIPNVKNGFNSATPVFREKVCRALDMPEGALFAGPYRPVPRRKRAKAA